MMHKPVRRIADGPPPWPPRRPAPWLLPLALAVLALGHCVSNDFAPDDERYVLRNPGVHSLGNLPSFFGLEYWGRDQATTIRSYRPIREASIAIDYALWGEQPAGYHLTSVVAHALVVLCVYALARDHVPGGPAAAALVAAAYAVHPSRVEAIATVENRADILAACFTFASILCWTRSVQARGRRRWAWFAAAAAGAALALASKVSALALPLALAALAWCAPRLQPGCGHSLAKDRAGLERSERRFVWLSILALFAGAVLFVVANATLIGRDVRPPERLSLLPFAWRPALLVEMLNEYLRALALPIRSQASWRFRLPGPSLAPWYVGFAGWVLLAAVWSASPRLRRGVGPLGVAWFLAFLVPAAACVIVSDRPLAGQRLYMPLVGLCLCVGLAGARRSRRVWLVAAIVAWSALSCRQMLLWGRERGLWFESVVSSPADARARNYLGIGYWQASAPGLAKLQLAAAFRLDPADPHHPAARNLAKVCLSLGDLDTAAVWIERSLRFRPREADAWMDLAQIQRLLNDFGATKRWLRLAIEAAPAKVEAYNELAAVCMATGDHAEAARVMNTALGLDPRNANLWANLGQVYERLGRRADALAACAKAVAIDPANGLAHLRLGQVLLRLGRHEEALREARESVRLNPDNQEAQQLLGTFASSGTAGVE